MNHEDPAAYILASALLSFCFGFIASALMSAGAVKRADRAAWRDAREYFRKRYQKGETEL